MTSDEGNSWSPHPRCLCPLFVSSPPLPSCSACSSTCSCPSHWPHSCCRSEVIVSPDCTERSLSSWSLGFAALSICLQLPSCQHDNIERHLVSSPEHQAPLFLSTVLRQSLYWKILKLIVGILVARTPGYIVPLAGGVMRYSGKQWGTVNSWRRGASIKTSSLQIAHWTNIERCKI